MEQLEHIREQRKQKVSQILRYFSSIMGFFYVVAGVLLFVNGEFLLPGTTARIAVSVMLTSYGIIRIYRIFFGK